MVKIVLIVLVTITLFETAVQLEEYESFQEDSDEYSSDMDQARKMSFFGDGQQGYSGSGCSSKKLKCTCKPYERERDYCCVYYCTRNKRRPEYDFKNGALVLVPYPIMVPSVSYNSVLLPSPANNIPVGMPPVHNRTKDWFYLESDEENTTSVKLCKDNMKCRTWAENLLPSTKLNYPCPPTDPYCRVPKTDRLDGSFNLPDQYISMQRTARFESAGDTTKTQQEVLEGSLASNYNAEIKPSQQSNSVLRKYGIVPIPDEIAAKVLSEYKSNSYMPANFPTRRIDKSIFQGA